MKNYCEWFLNQSIDNFNYKEFLSQQGKNNNDMEISRLILEDIDINIKRICAFRKVRVLSKDKHLFRRDIVVLYVVLLNKNYFNKKSRNYLSGKLREEMRAYLYTEKGGNTLKPTFGTDDIIAHILDIMHYRMTDRSRKQVSLSKTVFTSCIFPEAQKITAQSQFSNIINKNKETFFKEFRDLIKGNGAIKDGIDKHFNVIIRHRIGGRDEALHSLDGKHYDSKDKEFYDELFSIQYWHVTFNALERIFENHKIYLTGDQLYEMSMKLNGLVEDINTKSIELKIAKEYIIL